MNLLVVDDHALIRRGLAIVLRRDPGIDTVCEASSADEAIELASHQQFDVATVDVLMPHTSGISLIYQLHEIQPTCRVLMLSVIDDPDVIADILRAGAGGFALKVQPTETIVDAVHTVARGERYLPPDVSLAALEAALVEDARNPVARMTRREHEVFELVISGHVNSDIATRLSISQRTVEAHRQSINHKISSRALVELQRLTARHLRDN